MFVFGKCSYDELQRIRLREDLLLSGWSIIEAAYIDETEKIYDEDGALFEVFKKYRNKGLGKKIIDQFLQDYHGEINLEPSSEESESFWKQCGFEEGCYLDRRGK